jgi:anti-anti-sigma factor
MMVEERQGVPVAKFTAEDFGNVSLLEDTFQVLISAMDHRRVVVDLSDIDTTMSLGIAVLVAAQGLALIHKTKLVFAAVSQGVKKLLAMTGADKVLTLYDTVEDAVRALREEGVGVGPLAPSAPG